MVSPALNLGLCLATFAALLAGTSASAAPQTATLTAPMGWRRQDFGGKFAPDMVAVWIDLSARGSDFIPKIFLLQELAEGVSLRDSVRDALSSYANSGYHVRVSKAQRVCAGKRPGWFIVYTEQGDEPLTVEQTRFVANDTLYSATYVRLSSQHEDPDARRALNTLCAK